MMKDENMDKHGDSQSPSQDQPVQGDLKMDDIKQHYEMEICTYKKIIEVCEKSLTTLRWSIGILVTVFIAYSVIFVFKDNQTFWRAVDDAQDAAKDAKQAMRDAQNTNTEIYELNSRIEIKLKEIEKSLSVRFDKSTQDINDVFARKKSELASKTDDFINEINEKGQRYLIGLAESNDKYLRSSELWSKGLAALTEGKYVEAAKYWQEITETTPQYNYPWQNWGVALANSGLESTGKGLDKYFMQAYDKFEKAVSVDPNNSALPLRVWGYYLSMHAARKNGDEADELFNDAIDKFEAVINIDSSDSTTYAYWGRCLISQAQTKEDLVAEELFGKGLEKFKTAVHLEPDNANKRFSFGQALYSYSNTKEGEEKKSILTKAKSKLEEAIAINSKHTASHNLLGTIYINLMLSASNKEGAEAAKEKAIESYLNAFGSDPKDWAAPNNLGHMYLMLASESDNQAEKERLRRKANELFQLSIYREPTVTSLANWGVSMYAELDRKASFDELKRRCIDACEKFEMAEKLDPRDTYLLNGWCDALMHLANLENGEMRKTLLAKVEVKARLFEDIEKGPGAFYLACINAARGNEQECKDWLKKAETAGVLEILTLDNALKYGSFRDGFFTVKKGFLENMKNKKWFKEINFKESEN